MRGCSAHRCCPADRPSQAQRRNPPPPMPHLLDVLHRLRLAARAGRELCWVKSIVGAVVLQGAQREGRGGKRGQGPVRRRRLAQLVRAAAVEQRRRACLATHPTSAHIKQDGVGEHVVNGDAQQLQEKQVVAAWAVLPAACSMRRMLARAPCTRKQAGAPVLPSGSCPAAGQPGMQAEMPATTSAMGWMTRRKPPDTRNTCFPWAFRAATSSGMPGEICGAGQRKGGAVASSVRLLCTAGAMQRYGGLPGPNPPPRPALLQRNVALAPPAAGGRPGSVACRRG